MNQVLRSDQITCFWNVSSHELQKKLQTDFSSGLTQLEAQKRLLNVNRLSGISPSRQYTAILVRQFKSPLVLILVVAVILSSLLQEYTNALIILTIILLSAVMGFWQEVKATNATRKLLDLIKIKTSVIRDGKIVDVPEDTIVNGDIIVLNAGDIIPGDCRIIESKDLHINESALTGESFPTEKEPGVVPSDTPLSKRKNCVFQGTSVVNGTATAMVVNTGKNTIFGTIASSINHASIETSFALGIKKFGYLMMKMTLILALIIVTLNIYLGKPIIDSFLFGLALALGMTPELLPAIISISLSAGAKRMAEKKVIVKRLESIQDFGSINVLCADKTGTITEGAVQVADVVDANGTSSKKAKLFAHLNALFESGFSNPIDNSLRSLQVDIKDFTKVDEVPYDFLRKRLSVVVSSGNSHWMITKGAVQNILQICTRVELGEEIYGIENYKESILKQFEAFSSKGFRTIALAYKNVADNPIINKDDEFEMTFLGFVVLTDPLKNGIESTILDLHHAGIEIKLITGDNQFVAAHLSDQIGLNAGNMLTGSMLSSMTDEALTQKVKSVNVFSETEPYQKERIIRALRKAGHIVGYIGDGINDVSAMKAADVSISVDSAVDVAKESADIVLLEKNLDILKQGVMEGRKTFINTMKYIYITSSANLGNMVSMAMASVYLPFLPLLPKQILLTNFLTDLPAMMLPQDNVDVEDTSRPAKWNIASIRKFMLFFGLQSSFFDLLTFMVLIVGFHTQESLFQTGWFMESVITEIFILLIIRTTKPIFKSAPGIALLSACILVVIVTCLLTYLPIGNLLAFEKLPAKLLLAMLAVTALYSLSAEILKRIFFKKILNR